MKKIIYLLLLIFVSFSSQAQRGIWHVDTTKIVWDKTFDFEQGENSNAEAIWQFGQPGKTILNSPFSGNRALITDSFQLISGKRKDGFQLKFSINEYSRSGNFHIGFRHKFDFDSLSGGLVRISTNNGKTFSNVWSDTGYYSHFWWHNNLYPKNNLIWNGEPGFKGQSSDWIYTQINLTFFILVKTSDTLIISFDYESDSLSSPHEGWEIDEIKTGNEYRVGGIGDHDFLNEIKLFPNPTQNQLTIETKAYGSPKLKQYKIRNPSGILIQRGSLLPKQTNIIDFEALASGIYFLEIESLEGEIALKKFIVN
jgi:hypothetical protein